MLINLALITRIGAETMILDDFNSNTHSQWSYVSDQVMGGVSQGGLVFESNQFETYAQLSGQVSTLNNGGFIQFRTDVTYKFKSSYKGIYAKVKGNNQKYFIHLRTRGTIMPWQYYQSDFIADDKWQVIKLPMSSFVPSSKWLKNTIESKHIRSLGLVAFGRDHNADLMVSEIGFY
jgi:hypothetical protein